MTNLRIFIPPLSNKVRLTFFVVGLLANFSIYAEKPAANKPSATKTSEKPMFMLTDAGQAYASVGSLTEKQQKALAKYTSKVPLLKALVQPPARGRPFDKNTLYMVKNFKVVQKISGGYLIAPNVDYMSGIEFGSAFLKTTNRLTPDLLLLGLVVYAGQYKYTTLNGFPASIPLLQIPANLPIYGVHIDGDPFKQDAF